MTPFLRTSSDGTEHWLNWVVRLPNGELAGYVQATVQMDGVAYIAYELASRFWRQSIGSDAVSALLRELKLEYNVHTFLAVLKSRNYRSLALLKSLRFHCGLPENISDVGLEPDELVVHKQEGAGASAA